MAYKAIIDIDNTLWNFNDVLYEQLKVNNPYLPLPTNWTDWNFWRGYCTREEFWSAVMNIHLNQDNKAHIPYPEAAKFLNTLREVGFYVVIASHRIPESYDSTFSWLKINGLHFDKLHLSYDKTILFDEQCRVVVDDMPDILQKAVEKEIIATGLQCSFNRNVSNGKYKLFENLNQVLNYILGLS